MLVATSSPPLGAAREASASPATAASEVVHTTTEKQSYPEAVVASRRPKKRKGRPKRRSITLPSPPSLPRDSQEDASKTSPPHGPTGTSDEQREEQEANASSEEDGENGVDVKEEDRDRLKTAPVPEIESEHGPSDQKLPATDEKQGDSRQDDAFEERLRQAHERLLQLRKELSAYSICLFVS